MRHKLGLFIIMIGFLLVAGSLLENVGNSSASYGGVILIGPIPIVFGSNPQMAIISMIMAASLMVLTYLLIRRH